VILNILFIFDHWTFDSVLNPSVIGSAIEIAVMNNTHCIYSHIEWYFYIILDAGLIDGIIEAQELNRRSLSR